MVGKVATALLMGSAALNTIAQDMPVETPRQRRAQFWLSAGGLGLSGASFFSGGKARKRHDRNFKTKMEALQQS